MYSIYFRDPLGQLIELANFKFSPPPGGTYAEVLLLAHKIRVERGAYAISDEHLAYAIEILVQRTASSLSENRGAKDPYTNR